jgi:aquaporin Z
MPVRRERRKANDEEMWLPEPRRLVAEVAGTFALTAVAAGADVAGQLTGGQVSPAARAVAPGLLVMALVYALGDTSGAHFNPAVTLAFTARRLFPVPWLLAYWVCQLAGAILAGAALAVLFPSEAHAGISTPHVAHPVAFVIEVFLTTLLITVILGTADRSRIVGPNAAIAVGATIALCGLIALPVEAASMNPARSIGAEIVLLRVDELWIYVLGPFAGAALAVALTTGLHGATPRDERQIEVATGKPARRDPARPDPADKRDDTRRGGRRAATR